MEVTNITLDMIFALGIKEFSCVCIDNKIEQIKFEDNELYYWDTLSERWDTYVLTLPLREHLEKNYHSFFTWEIVNNEV